MKISEIIIPEPSTKRSAESLIEYFSSVGYAEENLNIITGRAWFEYLKPEDYKTYTTSPDPSALRMALKRQILEFLLEDETPAIEKFDINGKYNILCKMMIRNMTRPDSRPGRDPDEPFMIYPNLKKTFTRRELAAELENQTDIGVELVSKIAVLAFDLFARQKEDIDGKEFEHINKEK